MRSIEWTPPAEDDLATIDEYWWQFNPDRAEAILDSVTSAANFLIGVPEAGPQIEQGLVRKWRVRGTSYLLVYRILPDRIEILRVRHGRENWIEDR